MRMRRPARGPVVPHRHARTAAAALAVLVVVGCGSPRPADEALAHTRAEQLVAATRQAGVAPRLTVGLAQSLYGTDAPAVCRALDGGWLSSPELVLLGGTARGRRKVITVEAVRYGRLVVQTYCPDQLPALAELVEGIDPVPTRSR